MENSITLIGNMGLKFKVYMTKNGDWAWQNERGEGFTNPDLIYVLQYLAETKGCKTSEKSE